MKSVSLTAFPRELSKRIGVKKVRAGGRIPAVIYGRKNKPQNLELAAKELEQVIHSAHSEILLIELALGQGNGNRLALVREIQHHPLTGKMLHVDFQEVAEDEKVIASVPVETVGEAEGVKVGGGVLEHVLFKVKVRATPRNLPDVLNIDVSKMQIGQSIHVGEIPAPEGVEILGHKEAPVVSVAAPVTEAQEAAAADAAAGAAPTQPEMLKEKKEEGDAKAAAAGAAGDKKAAAGEKKPAAKK